MWANQLFGFHFFGTWKHGKPDHATLKPAAEAKPIVYPKPDGVLSFDRLTNVAFSGTNHEEDQKVHLQLQGTRGADRPRTCRSSTSPPSATARPGSTRW
jgi:electron-transferring-flavoprotein dehydrogenase